MALNTQLYESSPYFDDFASSNVEAKGYLKMLFKPGLSVQTRELNQLQTLLQTQVERFGLNIFQNGSPVLDGEASFNNDYTFIDVVFTNTNLQFNSSTLNQTTLENRLNQLLKVYVEDSLAADVISYDALVVTNSETRYRLYLRYTKQLSEENVFPNNVSLTTASGILSGLTQIISIDTEIGTIVKVGYATKFNVEKGVYFINGYFVNIEKTSILIEKPTADFLLSGRVSFLVEEKITDYTSDTSLLDNATGYPNDTAPGADRYGIQLSLVFLTDQTTIQNYSYNTSKIYPFTGNVGSTRFVELLTIERGLPIYPLSVKYNSLSERLGGTFAKRTYEESGNYCLKPFVVDVREAYNDGANRGRFTSTNVNEIATLKSRYSVGVEPSVAYVEGYRVELINRTELFAEKARDQVFGESIYMSSGTGTYIEGTFADINDVADLTIDNSTTLIGNGASVTVSGIEYLDKTGDDTQFRLYVNLVSGTFTQLEGASSISTAGNAITFNSAPLTSTFKVYGNQKSNKIVKLPRDVISSVNTDVTEFAIRKKFTGTLTTAGDVEITAASGETFFNNDTRDYIIYDSVDDTVFQVTNVSIALGGGSVELTPSSVLSGGTITVYASTKSALTLATKTPTLTSLTYNDSPSGITTGEVINLGQTDVYEIVSITSNESPADTIRLSDFVLDSGQRDASYENATLTYQGSTTLGSITIQFRYFAHSSHTPGTAYFSRESYPVTFDYGKIPSYKGTRLSDVFDFRHANGATLDPNNIIETEIDYYLPRYDQLIVNTKGEFGIVKGVPSLNPKVPTTPKQSMALYNFFLPAYTFNTNSIQISYIDNRRYTMRDIGKIEKRLSIMEYYTSLSLLEKEASDQKIFDENGERFKNGILVDSFSGHRIGNVFDPGYRCAMDGKAGVLRPSYEYNHIEYRINGDNGDDMVRLPTVAITDIIVQPFAAVHESVMPYDVIYYSGNLTLSPSSDDWKETRRRPDVLINFDGNADAIQFLLNSTNVLGTQWGEWENNWSGATNNTSIIDGNGGVLASRTDLNSSVADAVLTNEIPSTQGFITSQSRTGINTEVTLNTITQDIGDRIVDVSYVPFIRARRIYFRGTNLKPNTRMFVYIDDTNVTGYSTDLDGETFEDNRLRELGIAARPDLFGLTSDEVFTTLVDSQRPLITDSTGKIEGYVVIPNNEQMRFRTGERVITLCDANDGPASIYATSSARATYSATGLILDAENTIVSTRTVGISQSQVVDTQQVAPPPLPPVEPLPEVGEIVEADPVQTARIYPSVSSIVEGEQFTIILETENVPVNTEVNFTISGTGITIGDFDVLPSEVTSYPNGRFVVNADGTDSITFNTVNNVDWNSFSEAFRMTLTDPQFQTWVSPVRGLVRNQARVIIREATPRLDPLAQSFYLPDAGIEDGTFLSSIDLYFKQKHSTLPVSIEIVTVENGIPTQKQVPLSVVSVPAASVNVSDDASVATTFTFESPVFLSSDTEYAFIVRSNSLDYRIWMSETGGIDVLTGDRISKDPYVGVSYKSANASTWTPTQERDIKFTMKAHTFMTSTETSRVRTVGSGTVVETGTGPFVAIVPESFGLTAIKLQSEQLILPRTGINYSVTVGGTTYPIQVNETVYLPSRVTVNNANDLVLSATLRTNNRYLTPLIDLDRISLVCINNVVNNDSTNETNRNHGNAQARYITRKVELENPSDRLSVYLNVNRPTSGTNIKAYARVDDPFSSPAVDDLNDASWVEMQTSAIPVNTNENQYNEVLFEYDPAFDFTQFQVKVVLLSDNPAKVPTVNDLRAIATI